MKPSWVALVAVCLGTVASCSDDPEAAVLELLRSSDDEKRDTGVARVLALRNPSPTITAELRRVLRVTTDLDVKAHAAGTLGRLGARGSQPELLECAAINDDRASPACIDALARGGDPVNLDGLMGLLTDRRIVVVDGRPRLPTGTIALTNDLRNFGDSALRPLDRVIQSDNPLHAEVALYSLPGWPSDKAVDSALPALGRMDPFVIRYALSIIEEHPGRLADPVVRQAVAPLEQHTDPAVAADARELMARPEATR